VHECVVERRKDAGNAEDELALPTVNMRPLAEFEVDVPRGPEDPAGCSRWWSARPSSWEACWRLVGGLTGEFEAFDDREVELLLVGANIAR